MEPRVRVTGILIEGDEILLTEQKVTNLRDWSLPGGGLEFGETIEECIVREMKEETGLDVALDDLLYVCDRFWDSNHIVHITVSLKNKGGTLGTGKGKEFATGKIKKVRMVPISELENYGFSTTFGNIVRSDFPEKGTYRGKIENIGL